MKLYYLNNKEPLKNWEIKSCRKLEIYGQIIIAELS